MGRRRRSGSIRRACSDVELQDGVRVSASTNHPESIAEDRGVDGSVHLDNAVLASAEVVRDDSSSTSVGGPSTSGSSSSRRPAFGRTATSTSSSSRLEDFRRIQGFEFSDASFSLLCASWRPSSAKRYNLVWGKFKDFLSARGVELDSVDLKTLVEYFSLLFEEGKAYKSVLVHRSTLSAMLPSIDSYSIGSHPVISRLMKGIFH